MATKKRKKTVKKKTSKKKESKKKAKRKAKPKHKRKNANRSSRAAKPGTEPKYITPYAKAKTGRRATLTDEITQELVTYIQAGNYFITACKAVALPEATFYSWLERGEKELLRLIDLEKETGEVIQPMDTELPYLQFLDAIKKAEGISETVAVLKVKSAFNQSWQAAMTFLERRYPDRWKKKDRMELAGDPDAPLAMNVRVYLPDNGRGDMTRLGGPESQTGEPEDKKKDE